MDIDRLEKRVAELEATVKREKRYSTSAIVGIILLGISQIKTIERVNLLTKSITSVMENNTVLNESMSTIIKSINQLIQIL